MIDGKIAQHDLIKAHYYDNDGNKNEDIDDDEKNSLEMLKHCQNYLELPLIFKDADNMYLGISPNAEEVAISESGDAVAINMLNSKPVPKTKVRLVLEAFQDQK
mmetsp:Transcript_6801/g.9739  ORF Transcript_6801/g.9739 Transcript_6801/m.9739 type:complete len:104 (+) Transcript_6801:3-314(+)